MTGESFGAMLRRLRIGAALSQNALARGAGCDAAYVNRLERPGQRMRGGQSIFTHAPRRTFVCAFAQVLGLGPAETDRLLYAAGLAPATDWQTLAEHAEDRLAAIREALAEDDDPVLSRLRIIRRRTG